LCAPVGYKGCAGAGSDDYTGLDGCVRDVAGVFVVVDATEDVVAGNELRGDSLRLELLSHL